ncbi:Cys-tRNA(Pro) deacylase [Seleniivibrio woodruffii]|uniref:Cys-tRNA(Pro)/Cys-tRNA(Cys) deacylase n=2 Tax=Seleniivibrio woodruffii TaxID=1078050 RepID=A0A4R1K692_9BACT|nr:Cys-tRNA(Pro) deacylase [Seleniivibrio woodruffii]TVZ35462.1 Cys-tRNA(Pro) deacylase [Seleniivibrio woodruffii]
MLRENIPCAFGALIMSKEKYPVTQAVRVLRDNKAEFEPHLYDYVEKGGTKHSSESLGADIHTVIKTIILEDDTKTPIVVLMHGDKEISLKKLARDINVKTLKPCEPDTANRHTGYLVGGTSPFGTKRAMKVYMEKTIADLPRIFINGGKRGFLVNIAVSEVIRILKPVEVEVAIDK